MAEFAVDFSKKRPSKKESVSFLLNQFAAVQAEIITPVQASKLVGRGNFFLYESEVKEILENKKADPDFDAKAFIGLLKECKCVKQGSTPSFGEGVTHVNSPERAKQVANNPADDAQVQQIVKIVSQMVELRDKLNPLINDKAQCSIALKNKKQKKAKAAKTEAGTSEANETA